MAAYCDEENSDSTESGESLKTAAVNESSQRQTTAEGDNDISPKDDTGEGRETLLQETMVGFCP
jgi:hypothetical protein